MSDARAFLITGATGPVAEATVRLLVERGDKLLLTGRNSDRLAALERCYGSAGQVEVLTVDVTQPTGARHAATRAKACLGRLDGLVHLIGGFYVGPAQTTTISEYERLMRANFFSAVSVTQAVLPQLPSGDGRLVYVGSAVAAEPLSGFAAYAAGKAALIAWMKALAHEVKHQGVHANAVVMTMADTPAARRSRPHVNFDMAVTPEMVAGAVGFLTSSAADGLYGSVIPVVGKSGVASAPDATPPDKPAISQIPA